MSIQVRTHKVSTRGVVASAAFRQGYEDAMHRRPWRKLEDMKGNRKRTASDTMWAYERGRYFCAYLRGEGVPLPPLKDKRGRVLHDVIVLISRAIREKAIT